MSTGNVSIRLSIQDAETVRAALEKLGNDGAAALQKIDAAAASAGGAGGGAGGPAAMDKILTELGSRFKQLAGDIPVVGKFMADLGPIGMVAGAALGAVVAVMYEMSKAANELGDRAQQLNTFAEASGLTTDAVQALVAKGGALALGADQISNSLQHFANGLEQARSGTGALYTELHRISPELAHQVATAKDVASAYDLIGRAIANAKDKAQASGISQAAFGRMGGTEGVLAAQVYQSGGLNALATGAQQAGTALDHGLLTKLSELRSQIKEVEQENKDLEASWFAQGVLERTLSLDRALNSALLHMQEMDKVQQHEGFWEKLYYFGANLGVGAEGGAPAGLKPQIDQEQIDRHHDDLLADARKQIAKLQAEKEEDQPSLDNKDKYGRRQPTETFTGRFSALSQPQGGGVFKGGDDEELKEIEKYVKSLGGAATAQDKYVESLVKLRTEFKDGGGAAIDMGAKEKQLEAQLSKLAETSPVVARAFQQLKDAETLTTEAARERVGVASEEQIYTAKLIQINKDLADGYISQAEAQAAATRARKDAHDAFNAEQVKNSPTPGLTGLGQYQFDVKAIDQVATSQLDHLDTTMVAIFNHTEKASESWKKFGLEATSAIESAVLKAAILAPIAKGFSTLFGGLFGGGVTSGTSSAPGGGSWFADGGIMTANGPLALRRYAAGGVATSPQLSLFGEGSHPEAYVPLPDGRAIPVQLKGGGGGQVMQVNNQYHVHISGARGSQEIAEAVHAGMQQAVAHSAALVKSYDRGLPGRLADIGRRYG